ncbi:Mpo1-like protein [Tumebacillus flagellatus]|uniref:DUF962 domain-containing protein n=1 Tax=Tumebacillus flagellatus TaxID=1157490 RepID=A0A074LIR8_9BACL|nr:Mpo1-like protein [Tumebacillus flagellatus]KEO82086.1 hypothetical protein EL26_17405 [Tumebacillus flagellatus]
MKFDFRNLFDEYLEMHVNQVNRWLHVISMAGAWILFLVGLFAWHPILWLWIPVTYIPAMCGHFLFERNQPTFSRFIQQNGWDVKGLLLMAVVEEACVFLMALEQFGLIKLPRKPKTRRVY